MTIRIALTLGDPAGIGPDIALQLIEHDFGAEIVLFGSKSLLFERAHLFNIPLPKLEKAFTFIDLPLLCTVTPGQPSPNYASYVLATLNHAIAACMAKECVALVTGPIHKGVLNEAGIPFLGHTEYLAKQTNTPTVVMSFFSPELILGLLTTHLPLADVPRAITTEQLSIKLKIFYDALKTYLKRTPNIAVLGLNPHAGENGFIGNEEVDVMIPALKALKDEGYAFAGPLSADSAFSPIIRKNYDALFAMYHDQGLCGLKAIDFGMSVNVSLGLPFIRTSVDHGTAFDKAGTKEADPTSLIKAIEMAKQLVSQ